MKSRLLGWYRAGYATYTMSNAKQTHKRKRECKEGENRYSVFMFESVNKEGKVHAGNATQNIHPPLM